MTTRPLFLLLVCCLCVTNGGFGFQFEFNAATNLCVVPKFFCDVGDQQSKFRLQNVPGEGDCLFLAALLGHSKRYTVPEIRQTVAETLASPDVPLYVTNHTITSTQLLQHASDELKISPETYLELLRTPGKEGGLYGGGPELTILSNLLERPIRVFHVCQNTDSTVDNDKPIVPDSTTCYIEHMGEFGTIFQRRSPVSILILNVTRTEQHACRLWPVQDGMSAPDERY